MPHAMFLDAALPSAGEHGPDARPIPAFKLRTLVGMRWFATGGQAAVIGLVAFGLGYPVPLLALVTVVAAGVWANLYTVFSRAPGRPMTQAEIIGHLCFDTLQISAVLFLTGGIQNPFVVWLVMPAMLAASSLPRRWAGAVLGWVASCLTVLALVHYPLPWSSEDGFAMPGIYDFGVWLAMVLAVGFTAAYAHGVATEQAKLAGALAATQAAIAREERLSALDGLAAAAAHELGTPLGTIQVVAREMERELDGDLKEDAGLLISQTQRCQAILQRLSAAGQSGDAVHAVMSLDDLLREAAKPFLDGGATGDGPAVRIRMDPHAEGPMPDQLRRVPEAIYGVRNLIENAAKFARSEVRVEASWDARFLTVRVADDGPGFPPDVLARLGEPYPRERAAKGGAKPGGKAGLSSKPGLSPKAGLGLGFFIAKTLLERTGARLTYGNRKGGDAARGAFVEVVWPVANLARRPSSRGTTRPIETAPMPV